MAGRSIALRGALSTSAVTGGRIAELEQGRADDDERGVLAPVAALDAGASVRVSGGSSGRATMLPIACPLPSAGHGTIAMPRPDATASLIGSIPSNCSAGFTSTPPSFSHALVNRFSLTRVILEDQRAARDVGRPDDRRNVRTGPGERSPPCRRRGSARRRTSPDRPAAPSIRDPGHSRADAR